MVFRLGLNALELIFYIQRVPLLNYFKCLFEWEVLLISTTQYDDDGDGDNDDDDNDDDDDDGIDLLFL